MRRRHRQGGVRHRRQRRPGRARTPRRSAAGRGGGSGGAGGQRGHGAAAWEPKGAWRRGWRRWSSAPSFSLKRGCAGSQVPAVAVRSLSGTSGVQLPIAYPVVSQAASSSTRVADADNIMHAQPGPPLSSRETDSIPAKCECGCENSPAGVRDGPTTIVGGS